MMKRLFIYFQLLALTAAAFTACTDNDEFSTNPSRRLSFSTDTVSMDTLFSSVPSSTRSFWVYNKSNYGLRLQQVRLEKGNQTGFRVNVDGTYLDNTTGSQVAWLDVRKGDSIRVFVELTSKWNGGEEPQLVEDNLVFLLESGTEQKVNLRAYSWDAKLCHHLIVSHDSVIVSPQPMVIYGGLRVDSGATLTIKAPTTLYFHADAGLDVYGRLVVQGNDGLGGSVVMRGDRTDRMFDYLPYDRVSGQWKGIRFHASSTGNTLYNLDLHSATDGIVVDSAAYDSLHYRLAMENVTIHNCKGYGLAAYNANFWMANCQISNTLNDCLAVFGGSALVLYTTLAQFYPFDADRGAALRFTNYVDDQPYPLHQMACLNSLVTNYADDVVMGDTKDSTTLFNYHFANCLLRTPAIEDSVQLKLFPGVLFESPKDTVQGAAHFVLVDANLQDYDYHLDSISTARAKAQSILHIYPYNNDRDGNPRGDQPDIGCYQYCPEIKSE